VIRTRPSLANARLAEPWEPRFVVVGVPTGNRFARAGKGILRKLAPPFG
jgi:hypothetical protein